MIGEIIARRLSLIGRLSEEDRRALERLPAQVRDLRPGEDILKEGDRPTVSIAVLEGFMYRYKISPQGGRQIHSFYPKGETPCFETVPMETMDNNLAAIAPTRVAVMAHGDLMEVLNSQPHLRTLVWRETLVQAAIFREWLSRNSQMLAHAKMAHLFCEIMVRSRSLGAAKGDSCALPISQQDLGDALGMTTVHVNRTLQLLRASGVVEFRSGVLHTPDLRKLMEIADFDPSYLHLRPEDV